MSDTRHPRPTVVHGDWVSFMKMARPTTDFDESGLVLCLDPGETTGWALFYNGALIESGQEPTGRNPALTAALIRDLDGYRGNPNYPRLSMLVYEIYRIRGNKAKEHVGSEVVTIQHIGAIKVVADERGVPIVGQQAGMAKGFATDAKLRRWGLYQTNKRHANDAIRHGCYYLLFWFGRKGPIHER